MDSADKKILIVRLGAIGDVIRTLPALRALRANLPEAHLAWAVEDRASSLLLNHPDLDNVFILPRNEWQQRPLSVATLKQVRDFFRELRRERFDYVLDFHGLFKSGLVTYFSGGKTRIGYSQPFCREGNHLFTSRHVSLPAHKMNRVEKNLVLLTSLGLPLDHHDPIIPVSAEDEFLADSIINSSGRKPNRLKVVVHPGSSPQTPYKRWNHQRYAQLADSIIQRFGGTIFFTAGKAEQALVAKIIDCMTESECVICKTKTLTQLAAVIRKCDLYIGNDTAPMHLAAFMGTPVVALFGPTDRTENSPFGKGKSIVIQKDVSCNPCRKRTCDNLVCMNAIQVNDVLQAVEHILAATRGKPPYNSEQSCGDC